MQLITNNNFISCGYSSFLYEWQKYYKNNFITFFEEIDRLKNGLDSESQKTIDDFIEKILFKLKLPTNNYLIKKNYLYSSIDQKIINRETLTSTESNNLRIKYKIKNNYLLQTSVFRYHNGLKHLPTGLSKTIKNKVIIDGGAYYGDSSLVFTKYSPKKIYSFEPSSVNFKILKKIIANNKLHNIIIPINKGVYEFNGWYKLNYNSNYKPNLGAKVCFNKTRKKQELVNLVYTNH